MNRTRFFALLSLSALLFMGCGGNSGDPGPSAPLTPAVGPPVALNLLDALDYEVLSGTLTPGSGGALGQNLRTWRPYGGCWFDLLVPPTALNPEGDPINFTMRIPTRASYEAHPEIADRIIIRLGPDGMQFLTPITITATWMPWMGTPASTLFIDSGQGPLTPVVPVYDSNTNRWHVEFKVTHFSDWEVGPQCCGK